jgi:hypothetical protein
MSSSLLEEMFTPPKLETGDQVIRRDAGLLGRRRGTILSSGGWFAVVQWHGMPKPRREYIPDLQIEDAW